MCLAVFAFDTCSKFSLVLAFNRDEDFTRWGPILLYTMPSTVYYYKCFIDGCRETKPAHWWEDLDAFRQAFGDTDKILLGGRDCVAGGTWLCCSRVTNRVSFLTNGRPGLRSDSFKTVGQPSRGELPVLSCLHHAGQLNEFLSEGLQKDRYAPFHLITAEFTSEKLEMYYTTNNRRDSPVPISKGIHVLSNLDIDGTWPKSTRAKEKFREMVEAGVFDGDGEFPWDCVFSCMRDDGGQSIQDSANIFVHPIQLMDGRVWGTRSITVVVVHRNGRVEYKEQSLHHRHHRSWEETYHHFTMKQ